jgi:sigma-B regulation protein RsbU (phosphoserine phosphatase)
MGDGAQAARRLAVLEAVTDSTLLAVGFEKFVEVMLSRVHDLFEVDTVTVLLIDPSGERLLAKATVGLNEEVYQGVRVPLGAGFAGRIAATRSPVRIDHVDASTVVNPLLWERGLHSLLGVPMVADGELIGVLHIGSVARREFTDTEAEHLQLVADRIAITAHAHQGRAEQAAAGMLVESLLPARLPTADGWELAGRYIPGADVGVGGDWYDVFPLSGDRIGVVIGDVVGHGLPAAIVMGRLRSALRAYALEFADPATVLGRLDRKASHFEGHTMATVLYAIIDTVSAQVTLSLAGHLPPVLAEPGQPARFVEAPVGHPVGFGLAITGRPQVSLDIPAGSVLAFYTDGLVERPGSDLDERLEQLRRVVRPESPEMLCAHVMAAMVGSEPATDDIALVAVHHTAVTRGE